MAKDKSNRGLSGSTLKIIAIITMLLDHIGASIMKARAFGYARDERIDMKNIASIMGSNNRYVITYYILRKIGRIAFPIFCFLLVEGFKYTRSRIRYALQLLVFAFISEVPFDLALYHRTFNWESQNVLFTLLLGLLAIWTINILERAILTKPINMMIITNPESTMLLMCGEVAITCIFMLIAIFLKTDYSYIGVLVIVAIYIVKNNLIASMVSYITLFCYSLGEWSAIPIIPLTRMYNGQRGIRIKYLFYIFYPLHLFLLYLVYAF